MSINKRLRFELKTISDRLSEIQTEYNTQPSKCGPITNIKVNTKSGYIRVKFINHAYLIFVYKGAYMFGWFSRNDTCFVQDGCVTCVDVSQVCRELNDRIFSGFSPVRGLKWYQYGIPKKKRVKKRGE